LTLTRATQTKKNTESIFFEAEEFDKKFDEGEDITEYLDLKKARRPGQEQKRVNVDFPI